MSAGAEALRFPGRGSNRRSGWWAPAAFVLVGGLTVALVVLSTNTPAPIPAAGQQATQGRVVPVSGDGVRVGGTSIYRYHPLPSTGSAGAAPAQGAAAWTGGEAVVTVGGTGPLQWHPFPPTDYAVQSAAGSAATGELGETARQTMVIVGGTGAERFHLLP
ncbi:MAG TPA: hypothetical protein VNN79_08420 [Actinomycetota bacterium]|nr:hypothetical protein [Actinomycetota bacterium]